VSPNHSRAGGNQVLFNSYGDGLIGINEMRNGNILFFIYLFKNYFTWKHEIKDIK
jgi:hypothetical protein